MAAQGKSLAARISRWELMEKRLVPLIQEMPHLAATHAELQRMITQAKELEVVFEQRRAEWLEVSERRKTLFDEGDDLRQRLAAALKFHHGFKSQRLAEFGVKPRRASGRTTPEVKPEPTPPPTLPPPTAEGPASGGGSQQT
jgi:hypothetical protein